MSTEPGTRADKPIVDSTTAFAIAVMHRALSSSQDRDGAADDHVALATRHRRQVGLRRGWTPDVYSAVIGHRTDEPDHLVRLRDQARSALSRFEVSR